MKKDFQRNLYTDEDSGTMFLLTLVVPVVVGLVATIFLNLIANAFDLMNFSQSPALYCIYMLIVNGSFVGLFFVYNRVTKTDYVKASLLKPKFGLLNAILCIIIAPIMLFGSMYLINYLMSLLQGIGYNPDTSLPLPLSNAGWLILNILILAVLPAICEELLYRGVIFNGLRKFGSVGAVLISALFFALAHGSAMQFFYQLILGVVLAVIVLKTGSIFASSLVHFLNNAIVVIYNYIVLNTGGEAEVVFEPWLIAVSFVAAVVGGLLIWFIFRFMKEKKKEDEKTQNEIYKEVNAAGDKKFSSSRSILMFSTSLILAVVIWCVGTFMG